MSEAVGEAAHAVARRGDTRIGSSQLSALSCQPELIELRVKAEDVLRADS